MELVLPLLGLTAAIIAATILHKRFPAMPLPLTQIGLGAALSILPIPVHLDFNPEAFMICLVAPILFGDGQSISRKELWRYRKPILFMALGLVLFTVMGIGYIIHYLIPALPVAAAFALAAVLSPTDAVAVKSMTRGIVLPKGLMGVLEGESLLNDAAGLVSFHVALAALMTGEFSFGSARDDFLFASAGGIGVGLLLGGLLVNLRLLLRRRGLEEVESMVTIQLITPFFVYLLAEEMGVSGILAVVMAGIIHGFERERLQMTTTKLQIITGNTWSVISYILNGFVLVLLGFLLPDVVKGMLDSGEVPLMRAIVLALLIFFSLFAARFVWVYFWHDMFQEPAGYDSRREPNGRLQYALAAAVSGVHGTITLATALSIPFMLPDGSPFPLRNTFLFISGAVILISLAAAALVIPRIGKRVEQAPGSHAAMSNKEAGLYIARRTVQILAPEIHSDNRDSITAVIQQLEEQIREEERGHFQPSGSVIRELQRLARQAEADKLEELVQQGLVSPRVKQAFPLLAGPPHVSPFWKWLKHIWLTIRLNAFHERLKQHDGNALPERFRTAGAIILKLRSVEAQLQEAAIAALHQHTTPDNRLESLMVIQHYTRLLQRRQKKGRQEDAYAEQLKEAQFRSIQIKRDLIQELSETGQISSEVMLEQLQLVNYEEMLVLDSE